MTKAQHFPVMLGQSIGFAGSLEILGDFWFLCWEITSNNQQQKHQKQKLGDSQHWQQHIDSAPRWCFKVEQLQEYGFGFQKTIQLLDMTLERSISVTEVWQFHFMQEMI
ncbi:Hypothetical_protein [Hexamita inflata]|uniref:Hypothetical_protein n=1 Tax=Hexamita inflata TaxID=28002 RepID=A0AA86UQH9_9EUKA|nr:Hypothetical protein HINF_LOCUS34728 [Hexamita inflata]